MPSSTTPTPSLDDLLEGLREGLWTSKADALRMTTAVLASEKMDREAERRLLPLVISAASDTKWEVRKAAAAALAEFRHCNDDLRKHTLAILTGDANRWVSQAAIRAGQRLRARDNKPDDWALTERAQDPTLQLIMDRIRQIGLRAMTPARIYDLATEIGDHFYRELAADTAHEIRTLLTPLVGWLREISRGLSHRDLSDKATEQYLAKALSRLQSLEAFVKDLQVYASPGEAEALSILTDIQEIVDEAASIGFDRGGQSRTSVLLEFDVPKGLMVEAVTQRLVRAFANLVVNAYQAMPHGGDLHIRGRALGEGGVEVSITDSGHGMTAEQVARAMERFRTTRKDEGGTGLGLPIAERIVHEHGGELSIESIPDKGTKVVVVLPLRSKEDRG